MNWVPVPNRNEPPEYTYLLVLAEAQVTLTFTVPRASFDYITLRFQNTEGVIVDEWRVEEPDHDPDEAGSLERADPDGDWRLLRELFGEAHRQATGYDRVISDVEKALLALGSIGKPNRP